MVMTENGRALEMDERLRRDGAKKPRRERAAPWTQSGCVVTTEPRTGRQQHCLTRDLAPIAPSAHSTHSTLRQQRALCLRMVSYHIQTPGGHWLDRTIPLAILSSVYVCARACARVRGHIGVTLHPHHQYVHAHGPEQLKSSCHAS